MDSQHQTRSTPLFPIHKRFFFTTDNRCVSIKIDIINKEEHFMKVCIVDRWEADLKVAVVDSREADLKVAIVDR